MDTLIMLLCIAFFGGISLTGFVMPNRIIEMFGSTPHADMRNEIRTVYGGMCLAIAGLGVAALLGLIPVRWPASVFALVLLSNAFGRGVGMLLERVSTIVPVFLVLELVLGGLALWVALKSKGFT